MVGSNTSTANSQQAANAYITQKYAASCAVECDNVMSGVSFDFINSVLDGNLDITQSCAANAQCVFNSTSNALADVLFSAQNSTTSSGGIFPSWSSNFASSSSYQQINEQVMQAITQKCNVISANDASNVSVFAENSTIGGNVVFSQTGTSSGDCQFNNMMSATDIATGSASNCSTAGKKGKKACGGKGGSMENIFLYVGAGMLALMVAGMIFKAVRNLKAQATAN